jgi:hypothetical protein
VLIFGPPFILIERIGLKICGVLSILPDALCLTVLIFFFTRESPPYRRHACESGFAYLM